MSDNSHQELCRCADLAGDVGDVVLASPLVVVEAVAGSEARPLPTVLVQLLLRRVSRYRFVLGARFGHVLAALLVAVQPTVLRGGGSVREEI